MRSPRIRVLNLVLISLLLAFLQLFTGTGNYARAADYEGILKIGGTGGAYGAMRQVAAAFQKKYPKVRFFFTPSLGSSGGIKAVLAGALDLGLSSRPLKKKELSQGAAAVPYGLSPLMLATSHKGGARDFSLEQIASLYRGEIKSYADGTPIRLILRPFADSDTVFLLNLSPEIAAAVREAHAREGMIVANTDQDNAKSLAKIRGALGWISLTQLLTEKLAVTPFKLEGVEPSLATLAAGAYPYAKPFLVVTGPTPGPLVKAFIKFLTSREDRKILEENGLLVDGKQP